MEHITTAPTVPSSLSEATLCAWLGAAAPGDTITYYRGALARSLCPQLGLLPAEERARLARLAARARNLADAGLAHLAQRRHGFEDSSYVLIAARHRHRTAPTLMARLLAEVA